VSAFVPASYDPSAPNLKSAAPSANAVSTRDPDKAPVDDRERTRGGRAGHLHAGSPPAALRRLHLPRVDDGAA